MEQEQILTILKECNVLLEGHFKLTSGKHSNRYMQCAHLFEYPKESKLLCDELAKRVKKANLGVIDLVVGPAIGGIIMAYQMAESMGVRNIFAEREEGVMVLRRGFEVQQGERILVCEDVVTTGGSVKEVIEVVKEKGGNVVGVASIVDRSKGTVDFSVPFEPLVSVDFATYEPMDCPLCAQGSKAYKPGSRT